jgi:hypothetical protein
MLFHQLKNIKRIFMKNKLIILSIALLGASSSFCTPLKFTIPNKSAVTIDTTKEEDSVAYDTIHGLIEEKAKHGLPFILAVVPASKTYNYFDADTIMGIHKTEGANMKNPNDRQPITNVYFFIVAKPTDTQATYLCSKDDLFTTNRSKLDLYEPIFDAYHDNNKTSFATALSKIPRAPGTGEKRLAMAAAHGTQYEYVKITDKDPVSNQQIQVLMNQKTAKGLPYIVAAAFTLDSSGKHTITLYDPASIDTLYKQTPGYGKGATGGYSMVNKPNNKSIHEVYYFVLNSLSDPELSFLCTGQEILTGYGHSAQLYKDVLTANRNNDKAAYTAAFAKLPKYH